MRAVVITDGGEIEVVDRENPRPGPDEALVRVHGAGMNRADLLQRAGRYPPPPGFPEDMPGLEFAGEVEAVGRRVDSLVEGDRVFGITGGAAQAEYVVIPARQCARVPVQLDLVLAGGVPEAYITAFDALERATFNPGEHVLVSAVGSGVGTALIQLVKAQGGIVTGTARSAAKLSEARHLGLDHGVLTTDRINPEEIAREVLEEVGEVDVMIDLVGGDYVLAGLAALAPRGRIVVLGTLAGGRVQLPLRLLMGKRAGIMGSTLRARAPEEKEQVTRGFARSVVPLFAELRVRPIVERVFPVTDAADAYELLASDTTFGKVVLDLR